MKKILVPSDLSDVAEEGLKMAVKLSAKLNSEIYLVNFFEAPSPASSLFAVSRLLNSGESSHVAVGVEALRKNKAKLALLASHYAQHGVVIKYDIVNEKLKAGISSYIAENAIDMVVMGTGAQTMPEQLFTGTHAEQVSEKAPCPVLTVTTTQGIDLSAMVILLDRKSLASINLHGDNVMELVGKLCLKVHIVCAFNPAERVEPQEIEKLKSLTRSFNNDYSDYEFAADTDKEKLIIEFAKRKGAGIISMFTNVKNGFWGIINDNLTRRILHSTNIPILNIDPDNIR